jgi:hypothetical protein
MLLEKNVDKVLSDLEWQNLSDECFFLF